MADVSRSVLTADCPPEAVPSPSPVSGPEDRLGTFVLLKRWTDYMAVSGRYSASTRRQYARYVIAFMATVLVDLTAIDEDDVVAYLRELPENGHMRGMSLRALRAFYSWAEEREHVARSPVHRLRVPPKKYGRPRSLTDDELEALFTAAERLDPRARPVLELMYATGGRLGSVAALEPGDVDIGAALVRFRVTKGDRPYEVPLGDRGMRAALTLLSLVDWKPKMATHRRPTLVGVGPGTIERWCSLAGEIAGLHAHPHLLRHSFAERLVNDPAIPDLVVAELMNHTDTALLRRYGTGRDAIRRRAVERL